MDVNRFLYEQGRVKRTDYYINSKLGINLSSAHSDGFGVKTYLPDENAVILTNDRRIEYDHLVVATGMKYDLKSIEGFWAAWEDPLCPVYSTMDHPNWPATGVKFLRHHGNYFHGDAYFYIPPGNYRGEVAAYNFLATAVQWEWAKTIGKLSPTARYYVINGNDTFCKHNADTDAFIRTECEKRGIEILEGYKMTSVSKDDLTLNLEDSNGEVTTRNFSNLYAIPNANPGEELMESGLATTQTEGFLDVDKHTLRHNRYPNIFGLGDVNYLPTTKTWWGGIQQLHVVGHNVYRNVKGLALNAKYDGMTKAPLYLDHNKLTWMVHNYEGSVSGNLSSPTFPLSQARYFWWLKALAVKGVPAIYRGKSNGAPRYKLGEPKWSELPADQANQFSTAGYKVIRKEGDEVAAAH